jgi:uncharacterized protein (DUF2164 family)
MKPIELSKTMRGDAVASIQRYFEETLPEPSGEMPAGLLLDYFLEEIGPAIYNQAIADAQAQLQMRLADLQGELFADPMQYWPKMEARRKKRR